MIILPSVGRREVSILVKTSLAVITVLVLLIFAKSSLGQNDPSGRQGCALLDATKAPQFITYEKRFESNIRLRLRNNTSCAVVVETDDHYPTQLKPLSTGGATIEAVTDSRDGLRLPLHYFIHNRKRSEAPRRAYGWGDSVFRYEILPGQSITFDVPVIYFRRRADVAVPFAYVWEGRNSIATGRGGVAHRVYFLSDELRVRGKLMFSNRKRWCNIGALSSLTFPEQNFSKADSPNAVVA